MVGCKREPLPPVPVDEPTSPPASAIPSVDGPKLMPVDEGSQDPSFASFRSNLLEAVRRKDAAALIKAVNPKIRTSFGEGGGVGDFKTQWKLADPNSPIWPELEFILTHGGTFNKLSKQPQFWAPYVYSAWPESHDAFAEVAIVGENIPLRADKSADAKAIAMLSNDIVKRDKDDGPWTLITTADGKSGWVESQHVRSPIGYRAGFTKNGETWQMDALVAGD